MGLLKKFKRAVKKITKPVSRFLDKVVPNEIKPFLPYAAAAVPFLAPTSGIFATMAGRGALSGGANILSQLAQEGSEGDFSGLSALLAAGTGALSAPGAGDTLRSGIAKTTAREAGIMAQSGVTPTGAIGEGFLQGAENFARQGLGSMADATGTARSILSPDGIKAGLNRETLAAAAIPLGQGTTDLAMSTARKALKDYEDELAAYEAETGEAQTASDADRRSAIIAAMTAGQHSQDVIDETLSLLGLKDGGRVGLREGGVLGQILPQATSITSIAGFQPFMGRPAFAPLQQAQAVFPRLNQLEQGVDRAEETLGRIRSRLGAEQTGTLLAAARPLGLQQPINMNSLLRGPISPLQQAEGDLQGMKDGGIMNLGGKEMDLRGGGFVPIGKKERADDVPARLSKNEFVMTADAVRAAGGGNINEGARRMYETMNRLEARA